MPHYKQGARECGMLERVYFTEGTGPHSVRTHAERAFPESCGQGVGSVYLAQARTQSPAHSLSPHRGVFLVFWEASRGVSLHRIERILGRDLHSTYGRNLGA